MSTTPGTFAEDQFERRHMPQTSRELANAVQAIMYHREERGTAMIDAWVLVREAEARLGQLQVCKTWHESDLPDAGVLHIKEQCYECRNYATAESALATARKQLEEKP